MVDRFANGDPTNDADNCGRVTYHAPTKRISEAARAVGIQGRWRRLALFILTLPAP
jgi:hypothetical protein